MNKITLLRLLILSSLIISIFSCKKDADYLDKYTGSFTFTTTVHLTIWFQNFDTTYSSTFKGQITIYDEKKKQLSINYKSGIAFNPRVSERGEFVNESSGGANNHFSGKFINPDEVQFSAFSESAGFSSSEGITGKRN